MTKRVWYKEELSARSVKQANCKILQEHPSYYNINNPHRIMNEDFRILQGIDAFLYDAAKV